MLIRPYREDDQQSVINLWQECGLLRPWNDPQLDILRKQAVGADLFLVGTADSGDFANQIIAAVMGGYDGHRGWMNYLAVAPQQRGRGLATEIIASLETRLINIGCPKLNLQVRAENAAVISFYENIGYRIDDAVSLGKRLIPDNTAAHSDPDDADHG